MIIWVLIALLVTACAMLALACVIISGDSDDRT